MNERIGVITRIKPEGGTFDGVALLGLRTCQLSCWDAAHYTDAVAGELKRGMETHGATVTSLWAGWPGPKVWDFAQGPQTLGIVPPQYRAERVQALLRAGEFAPKIGVPAIVTHLGFIPENPGDPQFSEVVEAVRTIALSYREKGLDFWFETGQETPVTVLRLIETVGTGNLGVNIDPANLILYGKGSPIDSLDVFGRYVRSVHAKDGFYPTDPMKLGREVKVGTGAVDFPRFVAKLEASGFGGAYIIEREISGDQQIRDIQETIGYLDRLIGGGVR